MKRRFIAGITILILIIVYFMHINVYAENLTDLMSEQNELQNKKSEADAKLELVKDELSENLSDVEELSSKIAEYEAQMYQLGVQIKDLDSSIQDIQYDLDIAQKEYEKQEKLFQERLVTLYEAGDTTFLDFILKSENIIDFISNYYLITEIAQYDDDILTETENQKKKIEDDKKALEEKKNEYNEKRSNYEKRKVILDNTKAIKDTQIEKLTEEEKELSEQIDEYRNQMLLVEEEIKRVTSANVNTQYIGGVMSWPVPGYTTITSNYGMRTHPITGIYKLHSGVDIGAPTGAQFIAVNDGVVTRAGYNSAYGNMVIINHGGGISTLYAHGSEILVQEGQVVKKGEPVLKVGSTGYSTGPHAHFEVRENGNTVNPMPYITNN